MALFGLLSDNGPLSSPDAQLALAAGLLSGKGNWGANLSQGLLAANSAQQQERANRQNDLQQVQGLYSILQQQEALRMFQAKRAGQPYTPSSQFVAVQNKLSQLAGTPGLSASNPPAPPAMPQAGSPQGMQPIPGNVSGAPSPIPNAPPAQPGDMQRLPQQAPQAQSGFGGQAGGLDPEDYMVGAMNPGLKMYIDQYAKEHMPQNVRPGGTVATVGPDGQYRASFYAPKFDAGIQPSIGPGGQMGAAPVPGYGDSAASIDAAKAAATTRAKQAETYVDVPIGGGQTQRMTQGEYERLRSGLPPAPQQIPQSVLDADKRGLPFNATQAPGGSVVFGQPKPNVAQVTPLSSGGGGLGVTPNPVAQAGAKADVEAGATNRQQLMKTDYETVANQNANAQTVISRLQTMKSLGPQAIMGAQSEKRDLFNGLLALAGLKGANDVKTAGDLVDKNAAQIALALGTGSNGTDALRSLALTANPSRHMTLEAFSKAVDSVAAPLAMSQAKTQLLTPHFVSGDTQNYFTKKQNFEKAADPRLWELQALPPQQQKAYIDSLSPADAAKLLQSRSALKQLGAIQ